MSPAKRPSGSVRNELQQRSLDRNRDRVAGNPRCETVGNLDTEPRRPAFAHDAVERARKAYAWRRRATWKKGPRPPYHRTDRMPLAWHHDGSSCRESLVWKRRYHLSLFPRTSFRVSFAHGRGIQHGFSTEAWRYMLHHNSLSLNLNTYCTAANSPIHGA